MRPDVTPTTATAYTVLPFTLLLALIAWAHPIAHRHHPPPPESAPTSRPATR
ncbi:hypothetical protein [Streptomyces kaniharaensis]|uniref:hypothetical protein n=1 Tax=Streptomyces kaniharaensis TaxID=212423 RepID=UPI001294FDD7|nr:hypothetical protein [Streptomyces kaniharaensis]